MRPQRRNIDWQALHAELEFRLDRLGRPLDADPERASAMLRDRARQLARPSIDNAASSRLIHALCFTLGESRFALALDQAREVTSPARAAKLPGAGALVHGIVNWRGEFVTVFELSVLLGMAVVPAPARRLVILRTENPRLALLVDGADRVVSFAADALQPVARLSITGNELFVGATADGVLVFDHRRLFDCLVQDMAAA